MAAAALLLKTFAAFFAVMDPIGAAPVLIAITAGNSEQERRAMVRRAAVAAFAVLAFFGITQTWLFSFFGFTMGAFRVAGGLFLFLIGYEMMTAQITGARQSAEEQSEGLEKSDVSITPLAVPMLAGPATITAVVLAVSQARDVLEIGAVALALVGVCVATWLILRTSARLHALLGTSGTKVVSRMMGLILSAMAVQFTAEGLVELFPVLGRI